MPKSQKMTVGWICTMSPELHDTWGDVGPGSLVGTV